MLSWRELDAAPGQYTGGLVVADLDGGHHEVFAAPTVE
jgi:hypothetical protein